MNKKAFLWVCALVLGVIAGVIFWQGALWLSASNKTQLMGEAYNRVETLSKTVALTFDDGPNPPHTISILDTLSRYQIKATFFIVGKYTSEFPHIVKRIISEGHQIGNHSWSHKNLIFRSPWFVKSKIIKTDNTLRSLGYNDEIFFRSPRGKKLVVLPWILSRMDKPDILFDVVAMNWEELPVLPFQKHEGSLCSIGLAQIRNTGLCQSCKCLHSLLSSVTLAKLVIICMMTVINFIFYKFIVYTA